MQSPVLTISLFLVLALISCRDHQQNGNLVFEKGCSINQILIPDDADEIIRFAAAELKKYMRDMTGAELRISQFSSRRGGESAIRLIHEKNDMLKWDGFTIETSHRGIWISASESRGLLYGVYTFLEEAGCSFFYPGEMEEVVPRMEKLLLPYRSEVFNPLLEFRGLTPYGLQAGSMESGRKLIDWMAKNRMNFILVSEDRPSDCAGNAHASIWKEVSDDLLPELQRRGFVIEMSEHCTHVFFPRSLFDQHPDWFALNDGERKLGEPPYSGQMCYSNQDAVDYYAASIADYAAVHPEFKIIGTWPLDGGNYCECEGCKDPQTVFNAAERVAEKVRKVRPHMIVEHLAYKPQTWQPPDQNIPANMSVLWCPDTGVLDELAGEWIRKSGMAGGVFRFEYNMGDNYRSRANVWLRPGYAVEAVKHASENGFRGVNSLFLPMESWWRPCFNHWFFARACWDSAFEIGDGLHEYCQKYYGRQAMAMEEVFITIFTELHPEPYVDISAESCTGRSPDTGPLAKKIGDKLDRIMEDNMDPVIDERITRVKIYVEFFGLYTEAFTRRESGDLERLLQYIKEHPEHEMVLIYPEYFRWRNQEVFPLPG